MTMEHGPEPSIEEIFQFVKKKQVFSEENKLALELYKPGLVNQIQSLLAAAEILTRTIVLTDSYFAGQPQEDQYIYNEQIKAISEKIIRHQENPLEMVRLHCEFTARYLPDIYKELSGHFGINPENPPNFSHL